MWVRSFGWRGGGKEGMRWSGTVVLSCLSVCVGVGGVFIFRREEERRSRLLCLGGRKEITHRNQSVYGMLSQLEVDASVSNGEYRVAHRAAISFPLVTTVHGGKLDRNNLKACGFFNETGVCPFY
jgi:hypothetical protein